MAKRKWLVVAKNEYRLLTSRFRRGRQLFLPIVTVLLILYVALLPHLVGRVWDGIEGLILSVRALVMISIFIFMLFIWFMIIPITYTLRDIKIAHQEIYLSAPIRPSDILLGEFMGQVPFYAIGITLVVGVFTAFMHPIGMDPVQITLSIAGVILLLLTAVWIGTVISALLRTKLGKLGKGRDVGKAMSMLLALPMVGLMYALMGGRLWGALADPAAREGWRVAMSWFPSTWASDMILGFALHPGDIAGDALWTALRFGGLVALFACSLLVGTKLADRVYNLETTTFTATEVRQDGAFYRGVHRLGGGASTGTILRTVFKDYGRRMENVSMVSYVVGLVILVTFFLPADDVSEGGIMMPLFLPITIFPMLSALVVGEVTARSKENIFIFRKAPGGLDRLIRARIVHGLAIILPLSLFLTTGLILYHGGYGPLEALAGIGMVLGIAMGSLALALGVALWRPSFSEKQSDRMINAVIVMFISMFTIMFVFILFGALGLSDALLPVAMVLMSWLVGMVFLSLGKRKIASIE